MSLLAALSRAFRLRGLTLTREAAEAILELQDAARRAGRDVPPELLFRRVADFAKARGLGASPCIDAAAGREILASAARDAAFAELVGPEAARVARGSASGAGGAPAAPAAPSGSGPKAKAAAAAAAAAAAEGASSSTGASETSPLRVVDAFELPRFRFNPVRRAFEPLPGGAPLHGDAADKAAVFRERFLVLQQRTQRALSGRGAPGRRAESAGGAGAGAVEEEEEEEIELSSVKSLLGRVGVQFVLGMLMQLEEGRFFLEDLDASVPIDLSAAAPMAGLYAEGCVVLAQGELVEGVFRVVEVGFPPFEDRVHALSAFPNLGGFGLRDFRFAAAAGPAEAAALAAALRAGDGDEGELLVLLSDVWLDQPTTLDHLRTVFQGLRAARPRAFVLSGPFTAHPLGGNAEGVARARALFDALCDLILEFPDLEAHCSFVLVPGAHDPGCGNVLPRPALPRHITQRLRARVRRAVFASNPCRLLYRGHEMVIFRDDLSARLRRNAALPPTLRDSRDASEHVVRTVLDQAHLCPLPLAARPVFWNYDHALRLYPPPDALVLADSVEPFEWTLGSTCAFNPGSFGGDQSFVVYAPCKRLPPPAAGRPRESRVEFSSLK
jgi:DNA polymerase epsilon subunit 2